MQTNSNIDEDMPINRNTGTLLLASDNSSKIKTHNQTGCSLNPSPHILLELLRSASTHTGFSSIPFLPLKKEGLKLDVVAHAYNLSTWDVEATGSRVQDCP